MGAPSAFRKERGVGPQGGGNTVTFLGLPFPSPSPPPAPPSLRGMYVLRPPPPPWVGQLVLTSSFLSCITESAPGPATTHLGSRLKPVRTQSAPFTQVLILPEGGPKGPSGSSCGRGALHPHGLGEGCRQTSFFSLLSRPLSQQHTQLSVSGSRLHSISSWERPPQLSPTHLPSHLYSRQGPLSDWGSGVRRRLGPRVCNGLSQNSRHSAGHRPLLVLSCTVSTVGLVSCLL